MFIATTGPLRVLTGLLLLALLSQLLSGSPSQVLELWCLEPPPACYRIVVRRRRQPLNQAPFHRQLAWLIHWLVRTWPRWRVRCAVLLALLRWKGAVCPPLTWGLLAWPLVEVLCLGLGLLCRSSRWRRRWRGLARWLGRSYGGVVVVLLVLPPSAEHTVPLLLGGLLVSSRQERPQPLRWSWRQRKGPGLVGSSLAR